MGKIKKIIEAELVGGTQATDVYPITSTKAVYDTDNIMLDTYIQHLKKTHTFAGVATPSTNPDALDHMVFYLAWENGNYPRFNDINVNNEVAVFTWSSGKWTKTTINIAEAIAPTLNIKADKKELAKKVDLEQFNNTVSDINTNIATKVNAQDVTNAIGELQDKIGDRVVVSGNVTNNPDEEDITTEGDTSQTQVLKLKDRAYDSLNASGKGYKILRKNWQTINGERKNVLTKDMINDPNTIYEIRYDFDLNEEEITIKENCILKFEGGSFRNGSLNGKFTIFADSRIFYNVSIINSLAYSKSKWFNIDLSGNKDCSDELIKFIYSVSKHDSELEFTQGIYLHGDGDLTGKNYYPIKESTSQPGKYYPDIQGGASQNTGKDIKLWFEGYSNLNIVGNNSKIISHQNNGEVFNNSIISLIDCSNIYICDLTIDGNKNLRKPKLSDYSIGRIAWRNNISANNVNGLYLYNVISNNSVMDGLYLESAVHNVRVTNCIFNNNYRQGITVGNNCSNVLIYNTELSYTGKDYGTQPMAGIDLEANAEANVENVVINNCKFIENQFSAVTMAIGAKNNVIANCYMKDSGNVGGITSSGESYNNSILNCYLENTTANISMPGFIFKGNTLKNTNNYDGADNAISCNLIHFNYSAANVNKIGDTIISDNVLINLNKKNNNVMKVQILGNETNKSNLIYSNNILIDGYANNSVPLINIKNIKNAIFSHNEFITSLEDNYSQVDILCDTFIEKHNVIKGYLSQTFKNVFKSAFEQKGITSKRPNLTTTDDGFEYYDTTLKKKILWNGTAWVNMDGSSLGEQPAQDES